ARETSPSATGRTRRSRRARPPELLLRCSPAAFLPAVGAERAFHPRAACDAAAEVAPHALAIHVGEADPEAGEARLAQAGDHRTQVRDAFYPLELLLDVDADLVGAPGTRRLERPAPGHVGGHHPEIDAPAVDVGGLVGLPVLHVERVG